MEPPQGVGVSRSGPRHLAPPPGRTDLPSNHRVLLPGGHSRRAPRPNRGRGLVRILFLLLAVALGVLAGLFALQGGDLRRIVIFVAAAAFVLAALRPPFAWTSAIVIALGIPGVYLVAMAAGAPIARPPEPNVAVTLLALLPALAGALLALFLRRLLGSEPKGHSHR